VVDPRWLLGAISATILGALVCGYLTLCLLVYQGQWQLVLHPVTGATPPPADLQVTPVRFGAAENGQARLNGWWIPAAGSGSRGRYTLLFLHDGSGDLAGNEAALEALHNTGMNLLAFDYRGFGVSERTHPTQARMTEDAEAALDYLEETRHLAAGTIVADGAGLGAALAAQMAERHPDLPAVILESPQPDVFAMARQDPRGGLVPLSLLFHERFDLSGLSKLRTPKLILSAGPSPVAPLPSQPAIDSLARAAAAPSLTVHLTRPVSSGAYAEALNRFFDEYLQP
jgi:pimeloyl-ACP methyl ester carboxylesterase